MAASMTSLNITSASDVGPTLTIAEDFLSKGVAQVIVALKPTEQAPTATGGVRDRRSARTVRNILSVAETLGRFFVPSELTQDAALASSLPRAGRRGSRSARGASA